MRKDLRVPPPDVLALRAALLGGGYYLYAQYVASGVGPEGLLRGAEEASGLDLQVIVSIVIVSTVKVSMKGEGGKHVCCNFLLL